MTAASSVMQNLTPIGVKPKNEPQARPLSKLPPEKQPEAWEKAQKRAGTPQPPARVVKEDTRTLGNDACWDSGQTILYFNDLAGNNPTVFRQCDGIR